VFNVAFAPDSQRLVSASEDGTARLWRTDGGAAVAVLRHPERVNAAVFSAAADRVATASTDGLLRLWDPLSGEAAGAFAGHSAGIWSLAMVPGVSRGFLTGSADTTARTWEDARGSEPVLRCDSRVLGVAVAPHGRLAATALAGGGVVLWDLATCREARRLDAGAGRAAAVDFSPDGTLVAAAGDDGRVRLWHAATGAAAATLGEPRSKAYALAFSPDGRLVASGGEDRTTRVRRVADGDEPTPPLVHPRRVFGVAWPPTGDRLATACEDGLVRVWPLDGAPPLELAGHTRAVNAVAFTADGAVVASCSSDGTVRIWDAHDGHCLDTLDGAGGELWELAASPDGTRLAAVASDGKLHLYAIAAGFAKSTAGFVKSTAGFAETEEGLPAAQGHLLALDAHADRAWAVAFAPDGRTLVTGSWDGTARLWGVSAAEIDRRRRAADALPTGLPPASR
jgi:WD40 repeat protein